MKRVIFYFLVLIFATSSITNANSNDEPFVELKTFHASNFIFKLENKENATVVFLGDSVTEQNATTNGHLNHVGLTEDWLKSKYGIENVRVVNAGISGNSIVQMWERLYKDVLIHNPDLVIISSGINDAIGTNKISVDDFRTKYNLVVQEIIASTDADIILRSSNPTQNPVYNQVLEEYNQVVKSIASRYNLGFFDLYEQINGDIEKGNIIYPNLMQDGIHPNEYGHEYIFEKFKPYFIPSIFVQTPNRMFSMLSVKDDINLRDTGATLVAGNNFLNGHILAFNSPNKYIEFDYAGGDFTIIFAGAPSTGQFKVIIDGIEQPVVDTYRTTYKVRQHVSYSVSKIPKKTHNVKIVGLPTKHTNARSTNIQIQGVLYNN